MPPVITRVVILVLDGLGVGELSDAAAYADAGSHTLAHVAEAVGGLSLPTCEGLGLGNIVQGRALTAVDRPDGCFGRMAERSCGKDSTVGHWELAGVVSDIPFPTYPRGFPPEVIDPFQREIGRGVLGNRPASGTQIIQELGAQHLRSGEPIVYTSADSVFQIAAHEEVVPVGELYRMCRIARRMLVPPHRVARVIARPFAGRPGSFVRTPRRKDFAVEAPGQTLLDVVYGAGQPVVGVGKIDDLFNHRGLTRSVPTRNNADGMAVTLRLLQQVPRGLVFVNLNDFDTLYGHRNDPVGYARALREFDDALLPVVLALRAGDMLCLTADHGNDPTTTSTDHSREYVPVLVHGPRLARGVNLGTRNTYADLGQTVAEALDAGQLACGESFFHALCPV